MSDTNTPDAGPPEDPSTQGAPPPPPPPPPPASPPPGEPSAGPPPPPPVSYPPPDAVPGPGAAPGAAPGAGYGGLGKRFVARIIDGLLVVIPVSIVMGILPGIRAGGFISNAVVAAAGFAYFLFMETSQGATFGKQWLGMGVTDEAGSSPISTDASMRRNWWMLLGVLQGIPFLGWLAGLASLVIVIMIAATISSDARNQGWHDKLGGTLVVDRPR